MRALIKRQSGARQHPAARIGVPLSAIFGTLLAIAGPDSAWAAESPKDHAGWWINVFGVLDPSQEPLVERARKVFERVAAAADKSGSRYPRFVIVRDKPGPFALALPDGTVILTRDGLDLCYRSTSPEVGDSRLAFVLAHELSHLARDDFWHAFAVSAVRESPVGEAVRRSVEPLIAQGSREVKAKELQADSNGIVSMTLAGYSPGAILGDSASFLEEWVSQLPAEDMESHPPPRVRADFLRAHLGAVADYTDFFHFGVRLYQLGRYEDAILLLEKFRDRFPGREVFNNLGLSRYQLAQRALAECGLDGVVRFMLPTRLDPATLARRIPTRGQPACWDAQPFRRHIDEAVRDLTEAVGKDGAYLPGRINLASALLLAGENARALAVAEEALKLAPEYKQALQVKALALYLYGQQSRIETADFAIPLLAALRERDLRDAGVAYNLAVMLEERGRAAAAREAFGDFLALEQAGPFADAARRRLGTDGEPGAALVAPSRSLATRGPDPPIPLGEIQKATSQRLAKLRKRAFEIGGFGGAIYEGEGLRLLQLDASIEIVEEEVGPGARVDALAAWGSALREVESMSVRTLVYARFACDVVDGQVVRRVYFSD